MLFGKIMDGAYVDFEGFRNFGGRESYYVAKQDPADPTVFHIGGYRYSADGKPLQSYAPKIIDVWDWRTESTGHAKERRMARANSWLDDVSRAVTDHDKPWKTYIRLYDMAPHHKLRGTCLACGLQVVHTIRSLVNEARYGTRTVREIEDASVCRRRGCEGRITIDLER